MVKSGNNIKVNIDFGLIKPLKSFIYKYYGVSIPNYNSINSFIVNIELNASFWLFSKKDRNSYWGYTEINKLFIKVLIDIPFYN